MKRQLVIEFPLPPRELSQNATREGSWAKKAEARRIYRACCANMAKQKKATLWKSNRFPLLCPVVINVRFLDGRLKRGVVGWKPAMEGVYCPRDILNGCGAIKAIPDALVDAKILAGDDHKRLKLGSVEILTTKKEHKGKCCVEITLEWEDFDAGKED